jgi:hypothetical protein
MYSGTSSVPKISSGSRSRLKEQREANREIANKSKKQIERKSLSNGTLLWWNVVLFDGFLSLIRHGLGVFSFGEKM